MNMKMASPDSVGFGCLLTTNRTNIAHLHNSLLYNLSSQVLTNTYNTR